MDKIVHTVAGPSRKFNCYVYQLDMKPDDNTKRRSTRVKSKNLRETATRTRTSRSRRVRRQNPGFYNEDSDD